MTTANPIDIVRAPARLCMNPTNLSIDFPHGGTALGLFKQKVLRPGIARAVVTAEELGGIPVDMVEQGATWTLSAILRSYDPDAISTVFSDTVAGSVTGKRVIHSPGRVATGEKAPGRLRAQDSVILVISPIDLDRTPMGIMFNAIPMVDEAAALNFALNTNMEIGVVFTGIPDSIGRVMSIGMREDLASEIT